MKRFTVSILTYKAVEHAKRCVESVIANSSMDETSLILTANGSNAARNYFKDVKAKYPDSVVVVENEENKGFIEPNKHALTLCDTEFFVLLNDDVVVRESGWLNKLAEPFGKYDHAALSGPDGTCQSLSYDFHGHYGPAFEYLEGSMLCCKTEIVKKHGLFSDYLAFAYGEDSDLSLRMRKLGYTLHKVPLRFSHAQAQTSRHVPEIKAHQAKNHAVLRKKWAHYLRARRMDFPIIVRRMAAHGDVLLTTPIIKALKEEWPLSEITVETAIPDVFAGNPYVARAVNKAPRSHEAMFINLDMAYENKTNIHIVDAYAQVAGVALDRKITEIFTPYSKENNEKWVAIHPGPTTWVGKNWPMDRWDELCKILRSDYGYKVVLVGHGNDIISCDRDMRGRTSFAELAREIAKCELFIGVDSLPIHVAQAVKTRVIGIFGVTSPNYILTDGSPWRAAADRMAPEFGSRHRTTGQVIVPSDGSAMRAVSVGDVLGLVEEIE